jgi:hypothetical protein
LVIPVIPAKVAIGNAYFSNVDKAGSGKPQSPLEAAGDGALTAGLHSARRVIRGVPSERRNT